MATSREDGEYISLSKLDSRILVALTRGPATGYKLAQACHKPDDIFHFASKGTIYPALKGLLEYGLVSSTEIGRTRSGRISREYQITSIGQMILECEMKALEELISKWRKSTSGRL